MKKQALILFVGLATIYLAACGSQKTTQTATQEQHVHEWQDATCTQPKTCSVCGETDGEPLEHEWEAGTCTQPRTCNVCGETDGEAGEHELDDAGKCNICREQVGIEVTMSNYFQYFEITNYSTSTQVILNVEPKQDVEFHDVSFSYNVLFQPFVDGLGRTVSYHNNYCYLDEEGRATHNFKYTASSWGGVLPKPRNGSSFEIEIDRILGGYITEKD